MRNFSIIPNLNQSAIEQYSDFLLREVYCNMQPYDVNDPLFLRQLGVLQAEGIRREINTHSNITYSGFEETNVTIANSVSHIGNKIGSVANMLTSSLDNGFTTLNNSLVKIDSGITTANAYLFNIHSGINTVNVNLSNINEGIHNVSQNLNTLGNIVEQGFSALNDNLFALRHMIGQGFSMLYTQLCISNKLLNDILIELKIPETQRERRYHIEEGSKYFTIAILKGDKLYFEDAIDEFNKAVTIERKDFFSWFHLGIIYLRSKEHIDIVKSIDAFEKFIHYAQVEIIHKKNQNLENQIDEAHLYLAESYYLQQKFREAISEIEQCVYVKNKADFMKVKYLSAINENTDKQEAAKILSQLIDKNPYISLQVLEDNDIVGNDIIINLLKKLQQDTIREANTLLLKVKKNLKDNFAIEQTKDIINGIENMLQKQTYLESYEAIYLMKKKYDWRSRVKIPFTSTISDFEKEEETKRKVKGISLIKEMFYSLSEISKDEEIIECYGQLIALEYSEARKIPYEIYTKTGKLLEIKGGYKEAIECYKTAMKIAPKFAHYNGDISRLEALIK